GIATWCSIPDMAPSAGPWRAARRATWRTSSTGAPRRSIRRGWTSPATTARGPRRTPRYAERFRPAARMRPARALIDLDAVVHNYRHARRLGGGRALAVVKADAYGHGAVACARALDGEADGFGVACIEEALEL